MISNRRDALVQCLGELLYVERRLADRVLDELRAQARDDELRTLLERHRGETAEHVDRLERAFRQIEVAVTSNLVRSFESAVAEHAALAPSVRDPRLADLLHARAALQTEHWEMAAYRAVLPLAGADVADLLKPSLDDEGDAAKLLVRIVDRLCRED